MDVEQSHLVLNLWLNPEPVDSDNLCSVAWIFYLFYPEKLGNIGTSSGLLQLDFTKMASESNEVLVVKARSPLILHLRTQ